MESAAIAQSVAERMCRFNAEAGESCAWYHGFRMYLRALGLAVSPQDHAEFYRNAVAAMAGQTHPLRVLVSGAVDYSMAAHVFWAAEESGVDVDVTVVDVCETPLYLNRWYSQREELPIATVHADILSYAPTRPFDLVCTNSFLGQFAPHQRPKLIEQWRSLLVPGGRVVTVTPVRPGSGAGLVGFSAEEAQKLRDVVVEAAEGCPQELGCDPHELARLTEAFAARMRIHPVRSLDEIRELFEAGGLTVKHLSSAPIGGGHAGLSGPAVSRRVAYASVIASRRGDS